MDTRIPDGLAAQFGLLNEQSDLTDDSKPEDYADFMAQALSPKYRQRMARAFLVAILHKDVSADTRCKIKAASLILQDIRMSKEEEDDSEAEEAFWARQQAQQASN